MKPLTWNEWHARAVPTLVGSVMLALVQPITPSFADANVCPVTLGQRAQGQRGLLESEALSAQVFHENFVFWPGGAGFVASSDGALGIKFGWDRKRRGQLSIKGRRLDAPSQPLRAVVPAMAHDIGFQSSYIIFPEPGCWEVTGELGEDRLGFVVLVLKIKDGPAGRLDL